MNKKMTYKNLMKKVDDGSAEIYAWELFGNGCQVDFWKKNGTREREIIEVTNIPEGFLER